MNDAKKDTTLQYLTEMTFGHLFPWLYLVLFFFASGCSILPGFLSPSTESPTITLSVEPTSEMVNLPTLELTAKPFALPQSSKITFSISKNAYIHPTNLFYFLPPDGWIASADASSVTFREPYASGSLTIFVTNVGYEIDPNTFEKLVTNREKNTFYPKDRYNLINQEIEKDKGKAVIAKSFLLNSKPVIVISNYLLEGFCVCILEWEFRTEFDVDRFEKLNEQVATSFRLNEQAANHLKVYDTHYWMKVSGDYFIFEVPSFWGHHQSSGQYTLTDSYASPDERAWVQSLIYNDQTAISKRVAGLVSLFILNNYYTKDIVVTSDRVFSDGREQLAWYSPSGKYHGITHFASHPPAYLLFSVIYDDDFANVYASVMDEIISSFAFHEEQ